MYKYHNEPPHTTNMLIKMYANKKIKLINLKK
jgi:hypothetical protein